MLLRRPVWEETDGFNESFFMYAEELEWCYRIAQKGFGIWFLADPQIIHLGGQSFPNQKEQIIKRYQGLFHFFHLYYPPLTQKLVKILFVINALTQTIFNTLFKRNLKLAKIYAQAAFSL